MSYDLNVYTRELVAGDQLIALILQGAGLQIESGADEVVTVLRGVSRRYSFDVAGPDVVEPEDVPHEIAAALLGARYLYSIGVEGTIQSEIPHAVRFARRLAQAGDGAVQDQQTDHVWPRSKSRKVTKPAREERVSVVDVSWHCLREELRSDAAGALYDAARESLPEALPRRFGEFEPLQGKLDVDGRDGFISAWADSTTLLFTRGSGPCIDGHLSAGPRNQLPSPFWSMSLTFLAEPIREPAWRAALRKLFITLVDELPAFYASAEVVSGHIWTGQSLFGDRDTEWPINPVRYRQGWTGLPTVPTWWSWLGPPYAEYHSALPAGQTTATSRGVFYSAADELAHASELVPLRTWLPQDLFSSPLPSPPGWSPIPLEQAPSIPADLRMN